VNSGSLYYLYPGKQDVLTDVLDSYLAGIHPMLLEPAWAGVVDPVERVFALLRRYRSALESTECTYGCPIGSIALEVHEPDPPVRERLAANFEAWVGAIEQCFLDAGERLPADVDRRGLAVLALTTMEGGVMLSRTRRTLDDFDTAVRMLRAYVDLLVARA
jgi:TetR/AcrR family transcriptional repressor of nem operon